MIMYDAYGDDSYDDDDSDSGNNKNMKINRSKIKWCHRGQDKHRRRLFGHQVYFSLYLDQIEWNHSGTVRTMSVYAAQEALPYNNFFPNRNLLKNVMCSGCQWVHDKCTFIILNNGGSSKGKRAMQYLYVLV